MSAVTTRFGGCPDYSAIYDPDDDFDAWYTRATALAIRPHLAPGEHVLELGCATGLMTSLLAPAAVSIVGVERSATYVERARRRGLAGASFVRAELAAYSPAARFDHVLATNVLHEIDDPSWLLGRIAGWLGPNGLVHVTLPNPYSLHRLAALAGGVLDHALALSDRAVRYGTRRAWPADDFTALARACGLGLRFEGGIALKPYPNATMAALPPDVLDALVRAADLLPKHAAMSYLVFGPLEMPHELD